MAVRSIEVSQHWGESLLRVERFPASRRLTVGPAAKSDFVAALDEPAVLVDGGAIHGNEGCVEIQPDTDIEVGVGDVIFRVRSVEPVRALPGAIEIDWLMCAAVLLAAILSLATMVFAVLAFFAIQLLRFVVAVLIAMFGHPGFEIPMLMPLPIEPPPPAIVATADIQPPAAAGPSRPFFERATPTPIPTIKPIPIGDQPLTRMRAAKAELLEERIAMLGVLGSFEGGELASILGSGESLDSAAFGGLIGTGTVDMVGVSGGDLRAGGGGAGAGGLGTLGTGRGGGGTAVGIGGIGTRGRGVARVEKIEKLEKVETVESAKWKESDDESYENGGIEGGVEGGVVGGVVTGVVGGVYGGSVASNSPPPPGNGSRGDIEIGMGSLTREQISRVVHQHVAAIQFCYETGLRTDPDLSGKVTVSWTVQADGSVTNARVTSTTLGSADVEACITRQITKWRFPQPAGGGNVRVNYPFSFQAQ